MGQPPPAAIVRQPPPVAVPTAGGDGLLRAGGFRVKQGGRPALEHGDRVRQDALRVIARVAAVVLPGRGSKGLFQHWQHGPGAFAEAVEPFAEPEARLEAERCLTCGSSSSIAYLDDCQACRLCQLFCPTKAIAVSEGALLGSLHDWDVVLLGEPSPPDPFAGGPR